VERCFLCVVLSAEHDQVIACLRCVLETVHDAAGGGFGWWRCFIPRPLRFSSVVGGDEVRPPLGDISRALSSHALLVLRGYPGIASWLSHARLTKFEWGLSHELAPPGAVLCQGGPFGEACWDFEVGQMALKRPAVGHFLAAGDAGLWYPREHETFWETILVHPSHVSRPEQCATREVVLEREDSGALLEAIGSDAVRVNKYINNLI